MMSVEEAAHYKDELEAVLQEDAHNEERILHRLDQIRSKGGVQVYSALLLVLTQQAFEESEARRHWEAILKHRRALSLALAREVGILIKNKIRDIDVAARLAGEEFGLILPETERMGAYLVAERIRKEMDRHFMRCDIDGRPIAVTLTVGVAKYPEDAATPDRLVQRAEEAMHQAKARGGNGVGVYYRERRNFIRFGLARGTVQIRVTPAGEGTGPVAPGPQPEPRNISRSGLLFESDTPYAIGVNLVIVCEDVRDGGRLTLRGRVVRIEELEEPAGRYEVGAAFLLEWEHQEAQVAEFLRRGGLVAHP